MSAQPHPAGAWSQPKRSPSNVLDDRYETGALAHASRRTRFSFARAAAKKLVFLASLVAFVLVIASFVLQGIVPGSARRWVLAAVTGAALVFAIRVSDFLWPRDDDDFEDAA